MKKLSLAFACGASLLAAPALAADLGRLPAKAPARPAPPVMPILWNGFYVGGQVGYQGGGDHTAEFATAMGLPTGFDRTFDSTGAVGGLHAGYNFQTGPFVLGIEGDIEASGVGGDFTVSAAVAAVGMGAAAGNGTDFESRWQASLRGRLGYALGPTLLYVTGGAAFADLDYASFTPAVRESFRATEVGWTVGGGLEFAFTPSWSTRIEYRYTDFGQLSNMSTVAFPGSAFQHDPNFHTVRLGVSYRFGGGLAAGY
jgi:outer membrane immunogenic protein